MTRLLAAYLIRDIPDFPKSGILFKDITPVLGDAAAFQEVVDCFVEQAQGWSPDLVVGIESRGFLFGAPVALALGVGFVPVRKVGKLPAADHPGRICAGIWHGDCRSASGRDPAGAAGADRGRSAGDRRHGGGGGEAGGKLGGKVAGFSFLIELGFLPGGSALSGYDVSRC